MSKRKRILTFKLSPHIHKKYYRIREELGMISHEVVFEKMLKYVFNAEIESNEKHEKHYLYVAISNELYVKLKRFSLDKKITMHEILEIAICAYSPKTKNQREYDEWGKED